MKKLTSIISVGGGYTRSICLVLFSAFLLLSCNHGRNDDDPKELTIDAFIIKKQDASSLEVTFYDAVTINEGDIAIVFKGEGSPKFPEDFTCSPKLPITIEKGKEATLRLSTPAKGKYKQWEKEVKIIVKGAVPLKLEDLTIHGKDVNKEDWTCTFPNKHKNVSHGDIHANFELGTPERTQVIILTVEGCPKELVAGTPTQITLIAPPRENEWEEWRQVVTVTREAPPPQVPSTITDFAVNSVPYKLSEVVETAEFDSDVLKPVVSISTARMFSSVTSDDFDVIYPDNYKRDVNLTLKENLQLNTTKAVSVNIITKEAGQDRNDAPIQLKFKLKLKKSSIKITGVSIGNIKITKENETINVSETPKDIQVDFDIPSVIGLNATLEKKDGTNQAGNVQGSIATFSSVALQEGDNEFVVKANATNADAVQFTFKVNYTKVQAENVNITQVKVDDKPIDNGSDITTDKSDGAVVNIYLDKEYEEAVVTINGTPATIPNAGNPKLFQGTLNGLQENVKTAITINASAKGKTATTFTFNVTYVKPALKFITKILALGNEDDDFATLKDEGNNTFGTLLTGLKLKEFKAEIADIKDKELSKLKIELTKGAETMNASFAKEGSIYVAAISSIGSPFNELQDFKITTFTLKLLYNDTPIETYTLNIKGSETTGSWD